MAVVITIAQQKGGAGKTMLAANLAALLAPTRKVALLDIDPQRSLARWHALRCTAKGAAPLAFSDRAGWRLPAELDRFRREADVLIVDSPPVLDSDARAAIRAADLVLVPIQPSLPDLWAADGTLALARTERRTVRIVINRAPAASRMRDRIETEIRESGHHSLGVSLGNRSAYAQAFAQGLGVVEAAPRSAAAAEMTDLAREVEDVCTEAA